ncbi:hypothetical protein [Streptomyces sp. NPDC097640]|uniref:hypothetical protein n=1 Tax=Streptomyces sp. NPDC097640 TaxID=3157229 RepID=UPI00331C23AD
MVRRNDTADIRNDIRDTHREIVASVAQLTETVQNGLAELRDQNRDLRQTVERVQADLTIARQETQQARTETEAALREAAEARAATLEAARQQDTAAAPTQAAGEDSSDFDQLLGLAAGVAYAEVICHRDTWAFLIEQASRGEHFRLPADISEQADGRVEVDVSGRTLIAILDALWETQRAPQTPAGTRHLAAQVYKRIGEALQRVTPGVGPAARGDAAGQESPVTRIIIDDRLSTAGEDEGVAASG